MWKRTTCKERDCCSRQRDQTRCDDLEANLETASDRSPPLVFVNTITIIELVYFLSKTVTSTLFEYVTIRVRRLHF